VAGQPLYTPFGFDLGYLLIGATILVGGVVALTIRPRAADEAS